MRNLWHIFQLGLKELVSLARDPVLLFLIAYAFTFSVYTPSKSAVMDVVNASIAIVNEDDSQAARAVRHVWGAAMWRQGLHGACGAFGLCPGPPLHETSCPGVEPLEGRSKVLPCLFTFRIQARSFEDSPVAQQRHDHIVVVDA